MKIYPRKHQFGGTLSEVNYYPQMQYIPSSSVAVTQGAWSPQVIKETVNQKVDDATLKDMQGLTGEQKVQVNKYNNAILGYNNLSEIEKRTHKGKEYLGVIAQSKSDVNELKNNFESLKKTKEHLVKEESGDDAFQTNDGRGYYLENDELKTDFLFKIIGKKDILTNAEMVEKRNQATEHVTGLAFKGGEDQNYFPSSMNASGMKASREDVAKNLTHLGKSETQSEMQGQYGNVANGLTQSVTTGKGYITNIPHLNLMADAIYSRQSDAIKRAYNSEVVKIFRDPLKRGAVSVMKPVQDNKGNLSFEEVSTRTYESVRDGLDNIDASIEKETDPVKKEALSKERYSYIYKFQEEYRRESIKNQLNPATSHSIKDSRKIDTLTDASKSGSTFEVHNTTLDNAARMGQSRVNQEVEVFGVDGKTKKGTISKPFSALVSTIGTPERINFYTSSGLQTDAIFPQRLDKDPVVNGYITSASQTQIHGMEKGNFSKDTWENSVRIGVGGFSENYIMTAAGGGKAIIDLSAKFKGDVTLGEKIMQITNEVNTLKLSPDETSIKIDERLRKEMGVNKIKTYETSVLAVVDITSKAKGDVYLMNKNARLSKIPNDQLKTLVNTFTFKDVDSDGKGREQQATIEELPEGGYNLVRRILNNGVFTRTTTSRIIPTRLEGLSASFNKIHTVSKKLGLGEDTKIDRDPTINDEEEQGKSIANYDHIYGNFKYQYREEGGTIDMQLNFTPKKITITPLSLNDLY